MSAGALREAAALMRERAEAADALGKVADIITTSTCDEFADHIASWSPPVALAVADWLDESCGLVDAIADYREGFIKPPEGVVRLADHALAVARAYLGVDR